MSASPGIYRYGSTRAHGEGCRIGVARHVPRGVRRENRSRLGYFDLWVPLLAPSAGLVKAYLGGEIAWTVFARRYGTEMKRPECQQVIDLLACLSLHAPIALGCFCEREDRCHRSLLQKLIAKRHRALPATARPNQQDSISAPRASFASPACMANWDQDENS